MTEALLPDTGFVRIKTILKLIPIGETTWPQGVKSGLFPRLIKLGAGGNVWRVDDIRNFIENDGEYKPTQQNNSTTRKPYVTHDEQNSSYAQLEFNFNNQSKIEDNYNE